MRVWYPHGGRNQRRRSASRRMFGRPSGTLYAVNEPGPASQLAGYYQRSLRDPSRLLSVVPAGQSPNIYVAFGVRDFYH
jgi:hypothetical protein